MKKNEEAPVRGTTWFVSRHPGAVEWARRQELAVDRWAAHLDPAEVCAGDTVIGSLPANLAAEVCEKGAAYLNLSLRVAEEDRGRELTADELARCQAKIEPYYIRKLP